MAAQVLHLGTRLILGAEWASQSAPWERVRWLVGWLVAGIKL